MKVWDYLYWIGAVVFMYAAIRLTIDRPPLPIGLVLTDKMAWDAGIYVLGLLVSALSLYMMHTEQNNEPH